MDGGRAATYRRRRAIALLALVAVVTAVILLVTSLGGDEQRRLAPAAGDSGDRYDPLSYDAGKRERYEARAADGVAHVIYAKSPGGAIASAKRTARWRDQIERAAARGDVDPDLLEGLVLLESAGREDVVVGDDPSLAAGLTQILAQTATDLLGMHVDVGESRRLGERIAAAKSAGHTRQARRLEARRRSIDERFDPPKALAGAVRYLVTARKRFGRDDLAIVSYHMGMGNLDDVLRRYSGADPDKDIGDVVDDGDIAYARLFFDSTPLLHAQAWSKLASLGDDSATYYWRVLAAAKIMRLYRQDLPALQRLQALQEAAGSAERVLRPQPDDGADGIDPPGPLAPLGLRFEPPPGPERRLRPEAMALLVYMGAGTQEIAGGGALTVTGTFGHSFELARRYRDRRQAQALQFMLDRLQVLNLIAWRRAGDRIHVTVAPDVGELLPGADRLARDRTRL